MRRLSLAGVLGLAVLLTLMLSLPARAQTTAPPTSTATPTSTPTATATPTSTPSPTPSPTPVLSAIDILAKSIAASEKENTMRITSSLSVDLGRFGSVTETSREDESLHPVRIKVLARSVTKLPGKPPKKLKVAEKAVGNHLALRIGSAPWQCASFKKAAGVLPGVAAGTSVSTADLSAALPGAAIIRTTTIRNIPVWKIDATIKLPADSSTKTPAMPIKLQFFISQVDYTTVRLIVSLKYRMQGLAGKEVEVANFSHYGEKVKVKLPSACAKK